MTRKETIVVELNHLMDEQIKALGKKLTREEAIEYASRARRIEELLAIVNPHEAGTSGVKKGRKSPLGRKQEGEGKSGKH